MFYSHMLNYFIRFSSVLFCFFLVCFTLFFTIILLYIIFSPIFQYNHPHTRHLAGFCLLLCFVCFLHCFKELVFGSLFCYFYLLVSFTYLNYQRSFTIVTVFSLSLSTFLACLNLARSQLLLVRLVIFSIPHHHHQHRAASSLAEAAFSLTSSSAPPHLPVCLPDAHKHTHNLTVSVLQLVG